MRFTQQADEAGATVSFGAFATLLLTLLRDLLLRGLLWCPLFTRGGRLLLLLLLRFLLRLGLLLLRLLLARSLPLLLLLRLLLRLGLLLLRLLLARGFPLLLLLRLLLRLGFLLLRLLLARGLPLLLLRLLLRRGLLLLLLRLLLSHGWRLPAALGRRWALCLTSLIVLLHDGLMRLITVVLTLNHVLLFRVRIFVPRILPLVDG